jgi:hypothetical protein
MLDRGNYPGSSFISFLVVELKQKFCPAAPHIWNRDQWYKIRVFGTYMYVPVCTKYILVHNAENGTYQYELVCTQYVQVL